VIQTVVVVAGGERFPNPLLRSRLPECPSLVVAADSGVSHAERLGLHVDVVVGDFDSADPQAVERAVEAGAAVDRHAVEKDKTDLELALDLAIAKAGNRASYIVITSVAGRLDHSLANVLLLGSPAYASVTLEAYVDDWHITVVRSETTFRARPGGLVTLLPVGGDALGVVTRDLRYPLRREDLRVGTTRGVSNVAERDMVTVGLDAGVLLALRQWADS
jgi:thiamine pyrophosphokinase